MKINYDEIIYKQQKEKSAIKDDNDILRMLSEYKKEYRNVGAYKIDDEIFFYRTINRKEFKELSENKELKIYEKEEVVCYRCILYPEDYDFENCDAGIPTKLSEIILKNSFVDSIETRKTVLTLYRQEMQDLDNQINCIINEAFPQFDIEEIETWDVEKTSKYLSRAEWKLVNLRGASINFDPVQQEVSQENKEQSVPPPQKQVDNKVSKRGKEKLTPEKLEELKRKYPEMQWGDVVTSADSLEKEPHIDTPALRPGW